MQELMVSRHDRCIIYSLIGSGLFFSRWYGTNAYNRNSKMEWKQDIIFLELPKFTEYGSYRDRRRSITHNPHPRLHA
jgi:hypothetical protein